eukprot:2081178-Rhodomonas_salina.3
MPDTPPTENAVEQEIHARRTAPRAKDFEENISIPQLNRTLQNKSWSEGTTLCLARLGEQELGAAFRLRQTPDEFSSFKLGSPFS